METPAFSHHPNGSVKTGFTVRQNPSQRPTLCGIISGLTVDDIDIFEINEAFASQAYYCVKKVGIPMEKVNPNGGAIALGHPLGCTGARQLATLLHEMKRRGKPGYGVISMCIGSGMGAAAVIEYPGQ